MPIDQETLKFLVDETMENALQDGKENLRELARKYKLRIRIRTPILLEVAPAEEGEVVWED
ncbi:MAG: hypothetical protein ACTSO7_14005 [Candidatus Heimdallarchaeota archaeon]